MFVVWSTPIRSVIEKITVYNICSSIWQKLFIQMVVKKIILSLLKKIVDLSFYTCSIPPMFSLFSSRKGFVLVILSKCLLTLLSLTRSLVETGKNCSFWWSHFLWKIEASWKFPWQAVYISLTISSASKSSVFRHMWTGH